MARTTSAPGGKEKRTKSKEKKTRGEGKSRTRTMSATQRTNEEIVNFLTTLGIQMETSAFDTPVTRRRQSRKKQPVPTAPAPSEVTTLDSTVASSSKEPNLSTKSSPLAFVSVTQDTTPAAKRDLATPKRTRKRQAISGDLSDYTITFSNKDLNAISTNFQSNVVIPDVDNGVEKPSGNFVTLTSQDGSKEKEKTSSSSSVYKTTVIMSNDEVIDAVARGSMRKSLNRLEKDGACNSTQSLEMETDSNQEQGKDQAEFEMDNVTHQKSKDAKEADSIESQSTQSQISVQDQVHASERLPGIQEPSTVAATSVNSSDLEVDKDKVDHIPNSDLKNQQIETRPQPDVIILEPSSSDEKIPKNTKNRTELTSSSDAGRMKQQDSSEQSHPNASREGGNKRKHSTTEDREFASPKKQPETVNEPEKGSQISTRQSPERKRFRQNNAPNTAEKVVTKQRLEVNQGTSHKDPHQVSVNAAKNHLSPEPYFPTTWSGDMRDFYGTVRNDNFEMENIMPSLPDSMHLWKATRDLMPPPKVRRHVRCERCKQVGHFARECTEKKKPLICHYCGNLGHSSDHHSRHKRGCPNAKCLNCGYRSSSYSQKCTRCLLQKRPPRCEICNVSGHDKEICPDNWRRYHSVTSAEDYENISKVVATNSSNRNGHRDREHAKASTNDSSMYKSSSTMYCANCGRRGHNFYDCNRSKFNMYPRNKPFIVREARLNEADTVPGSKETSLPVSYDSRRTVVMNSEVDHQPPLTVETIQVKIINELAVCEDSDMVENIPVEGVQNVVNTGSLMNPGDSNLQRTIMNPFKHDAQDRISCEDKRFNMNRKGEKCYQTILKASAHLKLLRDYNKGYVEPLEVKHQVQICVLDDGCKVHISGQGSLDAEQDLLLVLRQRVQGARENSTIQSEETFNENYLYKVGSGGIQKQNHNYVYPPKPNTSVVPPVIVVDDEEDDCSVIDEVPARNPESTLKDVSSTSSEPPKKRPDEGSADVVLLDDESYQVSVAPEGVAMDVQDDTKDEKAKTDTPCNNSSSNSVWLDYVSPLAGLSLSREESSGNPNEREEPSTSEGIVWDLPNQQNYGVAASKYAIECTTTSNVTLNEETPPKSPMDDLFEVEEFDYSDLLNTNAQNQQPQFDKQESDVASKSSSDSDSDNDSSSVLTSNSATAENVEIITLDDNDDKPVAQNMVNHHEERVSLIPTEWELTITESAKQNSIIKQIAQEFDVTVVVSKEKSSIIIRNGNRQALKSAKDEIVYWLEAKCMNMEYHFVGRRAGRREAPVATTPSSKRKMNRRHNPQLNDIQNQNLISKRRRNRNKKRANRNLFIKQSSSPAGPSSSYDYQSFSSTSSSSSMGQTPKSTFNKSNLKSSPSSAANSKRQPRSPTPRKMQQQQNNQNNAVRFPIPSSQMYNGLPTPRARYFHQK